MMKAKIENQEQYEQAVKDFEVNYNNDFSKVKEDAIDLELFYTKTRNDYNDRMNFLQKKYPLSNLQNFIQNWRFKNNSKSSFKNDFELLKIFSKEKNQNLKNIAVAKAEFEAIQKVFHKTYSGNKKISENVISINPTLDQLFNDKKEIEPCLEVLRSIDFPVINKVNDYLLGIRQKGAIVAWVEVLKIRGKLTSVDKIKLTEILNNTFLGLNISSRTLGNVSTTAFKKYYTKLASLIK